MSRINCKHSSLKLGDVNIKILMEALKKKKTSNEHTFPTYIRIFRAMTCVAFLLKQNLMDAGFTLYDSAECFH